ncbi:MAG: hypothetical protein GVY16_05120 [Planctomycetes bacterium]|nr:hypothetical protein [Phycisphaerae bacterium]NBB95104.1 hypothetical protein [Planctomycetota bacterium]
MHDEDPQFDPDELGDAGADAPQASIEQVIHEDGRYRPEAFGFLHEGLARAVQNVYGEKAGPGGHVSGRQLCLSLRDLACERYGMLAPVVLRRWGIRESIDFGNMVYLLIDNGFMRKTDEDSIEDFRDVFDVAKDFDPGEIRLSE